MVSEALRRGLDTGLILKLKTLALFALRLLILPNYCFKKLSDTLHACLPIVLGFLWFLSLGWLFDQISTLWSFQGSLSLGPGFWPRFRDGRLLRAVCYSTIPAPSCQPLFSLFFLFF
jgi:hypothetical protein